MTSTDPLAELASTVFRAWARAAQAGIEAAGSVVRDLVETTYREQSVPILGEDEIGVVALAGAALTASAFVWVDEKTGAPSKDLGPINVIQPSDISFEPTTVPPAAANVAASVVTIRLQPKHPVRTGDYSGTVLADGVALPKLYTVYVSGVDP